MAGYCELIFLTRFDFFTGSNGRISRRANLNPRFKRIMHLKGSVSMTLGLKRLNKIDGLA